MIELVIVSFVAGVLTVLAPCILPLLPIILGSSALQPTSQKVASLKRPLVIISSLVTSIVLFTLLLKYTTSLLGIPTAVWSTLSGGIVLLYGINLLFPAIWEQVMLRTGLALATNKLMGRSQGQSGLRRDVLLGTALGPVFNSCSPTYALIVAVLLPASFATGLLYLIAYAIGLGAVLLLISMFGQLIVNKLRWMSNPHGVFQRTIGVLFIVVGLAVIFGIDKQVQSFVLENGWYDPIMRIEESFRR